MTILVTGAAGFIGHGVAQRLLARGDAVLGIDCLTPYYRRDLKEARLADLEGPLFRCARIDFADKEALFTAANDGRAPIRAIVHLGAQPGVRWSIDHPDDYARSNLVGQLNLLELARQLGVPMVYASSSSVYGGNEKLPFRVEDRADHPVSLYAATKKAGELLAESYAHLYRIPLTGLRFFTVYGPWGRPDMAIWSFTERCLRGESVPLYNGGAMERDFTYIDDIVAGIIACLDRPPADDHREKPGGSIGPHAIYNIGNNHPEPLAHLVDLIGQACGRPLETTMAPMQPGDVIATFADIDAIARDHGFQPRTSLDEGIPRFVRWYRQWTAVRAG